MGIINFNKWLLERYPGCFLRPYHKRSYDYIYLDVNHLLHNAINGAKSEAHFIKNLNYRLDMIFNNYVATRKIVLAVDGTAPYSKVVTQRKRRLQTVKNINVNKINSLHLTPGTGLMNRLKTHLNNYIEKLSKSYKYLKVIFDVSLSDEPDEGELKIFKKLIEHGRKYRNSSHLIVGNDADLVVLALSAKPVANINLLIKYGDQRRMVSINKLLQIHSKQLSLDLSVATLKESSIRDDFATISIMMGNDYLPKLLFVKFESLWKAYTTTRNILNKNLIENNTFNNDFLRRFMFNSVNLIPNQFRKLHLQKYSEKNILNYLEGLIWCLNMYQTGKCPMYDYLYKGDQAPSPIDILYFMEFNSNIEVKIPESSTQPLNLESYTILLMPKKARKMVPEKFQKFLDNELRYIYNAEECVDCNKLKGSLSQLHKALRVEQMKVKNNQIQDDTTLPIRKEIGNVSVQMNHHKKNHKDDFCHDDISKVVRFVNSFEDG